LEVASLFLESGLIQDASRWIDECLRHRETPLLLWLAAWNLLVHSRMDAEAALLVSRAESMWDRPPLPWRPLEVRAVAELASKFPQFKGLRTIAQVVRLWSEGPARSS
jgi:hypothetical protein